MSDLARAGKAVIDHQSAEISDWEMWACANQVVTQHGSGARDFAINRVVQLTLEGDDRGASTWQAIVHRIDQLAGVDKVIQ